MASLLQDTVDFDIDVNASVFETNIRGEARGPVLVLMGGSGADLLCLGSGGRPAVGPHAGGSGRDGTGARLALFRSAAPDGRGRGPQAAARYQSGPNGLLTEPHFGKRVSESFKSEFRSFEVK